MKKKKKKKPKGKFNKNRGCAGSKEKESWRREISRDKSRARAIPKKRLSNETLEMSRAKRRVTRVAVDRRKEKA